MYENKRSKAAGLRMQHLEFMVPDSQAGQRIDRFLALQPIGLSRSALQQLQSRGLVRCNGAPACKSLKGSAGDRVEVDVPDAEPVSARPQPIPLDIVYEDGHLVVVNKPKGMVVHPAPGNPDGTLVNALLYHCQGGLSGIGGEVRPGIVHRIDKDTSGLLVVAKDDVTHQGLARQLAAHSITREYQAVVYGGFKSDMGTVETPIGRHKTDRKKMAVVQQGGRYAYTAYEVLARYQGFTHIACRLRTGRTHQIRVHMASIGHPVAGDAVYGPKAVLSQLHGQCLHAARLGFVHPVNGEYLEFEAPLPAYFTAFLNTLRRNAAYD